MDTFSALFKRLSGFKISPEIYPISERQNAVFPTQSNFIPERSPLTRFPDRGLYHSNFAVLERSAEDRSDPYAGHFEPRKAQFKSSKVKIQGRMGQMIGMKIHFQCYKSNG